MQDYHNHEFRSKVVPQAIESLKVSVDSNCLTSASVYLARILRDLYDIEEPFVLAIAGHVKGADYKELAIVAKKVIECGP